MAGNVNEQSYREMISELRQYASKAEECGAQISRIVNFCKQATEEDELIQDRCDDVIKIESKIRDDICQKANDIANSMEEFIDGFIEERKKLTNR